MALKYQVNLDGATILSALNHTLEPHMGIVPLRGLKIIGVVNAKLMVMVRGAFF
jgi:hypothetical protein